MATRKRESTATMRDRVTGELRRMILERQLKTPEFQALATTINSNHLVGTVKPVIFGEYYRLYNEGKFREAADLVTHFVPSKDKGIIMAKTDAERSIAALELKRAKDSDSLV